jgi:hypothetical protein
MKHSWLVCASIFIALLNGVVPSTYAQKSQLQLVDPTNVAAYATFWFLSTFDTNRAGFGPPLPWNRFSTNPDVPIYYWRGNSYVVDDTGLPLEQQEQYFRTGPLKSKQLLTSVGSEAGGEGEDPGAGDGPLPMYSSSADLCLFPPRFDPSGIILTLTNGDSAVSYDLYATTNLTIDVAGLNRTNWAWLGRLAPGQTTFTNDTKLSDLQCFYRLGLTNDCDGDSLPDAYEILVSHTAVCGYDFVSSDGYGTPDGWYLLHNLNPLTPGIGGLDPDQDWLTNRQEYLYGSDPRGSPALAIWISTPSGGNGLP